METRETRSSFIISPVEFDSWQERIVELRARVWEEVAREHSAAMNASVLCDRFEDSGLHWIAMAGPVLCGSARLHIAGSLEALPYSADWLPSIEDGRGPGAYLSRLVVDRAFRSQGIGSALDAARIEHARTEGCRVVVGCTTTRFEMMRRAGSCGYAL